MQEVTQWCEVLRIWTEVKEKKQTSNKKKTELFPSLTDTSPNSHCCPKLWRKFLCCSVSALKSNTMFWRLQRGFCSSKRSISLHGGHDNVMGAGVSALWHGWSQHFTSGAAYERFTVRVNTDHSGLHLERRASVLCAVKITFHIGSSFKFSWFGVEEDFL